MKNLFCLAIVLAAWNLSAQSSLKIGEKAPAINISDWIANAPKDKPQPPRAAQAIQAFSIME
jgi:hypothetical protein